MTAIETPAQNEALPWYKIFVYALFLPSVQHYEQIIADRKATLWNGIWLTLLPYYILRVLLSPALKIAPENLSWHLFWFILGPPSTVMLNLLILRIVHNLMRVSDGNHRFHQVYFLVAIIECFNTLVGLIMALIPYGNWINFFALWYTLFLQVLAVKAVYQRSGQRSTGFLLFAGCSGTLLAFVLVGIAYFIAIYVIVPVFQP